MKKGAVVVVASGAALAGILLAKKAQSSESPQEREARRADKRREMFEKMRAHMESMPEDFPPLVMFNNVAAIRENTDRIRELLEAAHRVAVEIVAGSADLGLHVAEGHHHGGRLVGHQAHQVVNFLWGVEHRHHQFGGIPDQIRGVDRALNIGHLNRVPLPRFFHKIIRPIQHFAQLIVRNRRFW